MERLSSCYFCGTAMDDPLSEYPVIPNDLDPDPDEQVTVTLCPTCRRKLAAVVERVIDAAEAAEEEPSGPAPDDFDFAADVGRTGEAVDRIGVDETEGSGEASGAADAEERPAAPAGGDDRTGSRDDDGGASGDDGGGGESDRSDGNEDDDRSDGDGDRDQGDEDGDGDDEAAITALQYNRVMRLLENRELPVDRAGFEALATSAYEVSPSTVEAAIEEAIERGHLAEDEGQLVRPDGA